MGGKDSWGPILPDMCLYNWRFGIIEEYETFLSCYLAVFFRIMSIDNDN